MLVVRSTFLNPPFDAVDLILVESVPVQRHSDNAVSLDTLGQLALPRVEGNNDTRCRKPIPVRLQSNASLRQGSPVTSRKHARLIEQHLYLRRVAYS